MEVAIRRTEVRSEEISGATAHSQEGAVPPKTGFHDAFVPLVPRESGTGVTRYPAGAQNLAARILCRERSSTTAKGAPSGSSRSLLGALAAADSRDRKSTRLNSSHSQISYAVFCLKKKNNN